MKGLSAVIGMVFLLIVMVSVLVPLAMLTNSTASKEEENINAVQPMQNEAEEQITEVNEKNSPVGFYYCNTTGTVLLVFYSSPLVSINVSYFLGYDGGDVKIIDPQPEETTWDSHQALEYQVGEFEKLAMVTTLGNIIYAYPMRNCDLGNNLDNANGTAQIIYNDIYYDTCVLSHNGCVNYTINSIIPVNQPVKYITENITIEYLYETYSDTCVRWYVYYYSEAEQNFVAYYYKASLVHWCCFGCEHAKVVWKPASYPGKVVNLTTFGTIRITPPHPACVFADLYNVPAIWATNYYDNMTIFFQNGDVEHVIMTGPAVKACSVTSSPLIKTMTGKSGDVALINGLYPRNVSWCVVKDVFHIHRNCVWYCCILNYSLTSIICFRKDVDINWVFAEVYVPVPCTIYNHICTNLEGNKFEIIYNISNFYIGYNLLHEPSEAITTIYIHVNCILYDGGVFILELKTCHIGNCGVRNNIFEVKNI
ncbi:hypothetical protein [Acidianus sp. HS-5]|uniref:hypothetical protein n=1 Tax=Acidianus sp. HS-5 TaxID=2886040 RepID=UPI001F2E12F6|nr:hypothetical protein [Acidianus sp. HS-5]BDC19517.1 hypothetical protein HS5_24070 [Acidianus sp. HS-5]